MCVALEYLEPTVFMAHKLSLIGSMNFEIEMNDFFLVWWFIIYDIKLVYKQLFDFRYSITKAFFIAFVMTFFSVFDVPVFWPILLCYWIVLFVLTMKRQILHMIKYKYVPFSVGKQVSQENLRNRFSYS